MLAVAITSFCRIPFRGTRRSIPIARIIIVVTEAIQVEIREMQSPTVVFASTFAIFWASMAQGILRFIRLPVAQVRYVEEPRIGT